MDEAPDQSFSGGPSSGAEGVPKSPAALDSPPPPWGSETRAQRLSRLSEKSKHLPRTPGVYLMLDHKGIALYIGKALRLRDRVGSYFQASVDLGPRKAPMLDAVDDFQVLLCDSEWEALLTENRLIKDTRPRFNADLTDDKSFPYLVVTTRSEYPGVYVTRVPSAHPGSTVLGPFVRAGALRQAVDVLQRVFRFRTCELDIRESDATRRRFRPCLLHAVGQCSAPCADRIPRSAYRGDIDAFLRCVRSNRSEMLRSMHREMEEASSKLDFERAARLRDQSRALKKLDERAAVRDSWQPEAESPLIDPRKAPLSLQRALGVDTPVRCIEGFDIAHLQGQDTVASKVCFIDGRPLKQQYRRFKVRTVGNDDFGAMREALSRRYRHAGVGEELYPDAVLIDGGPGQLSAAMDAFALLASKPPLVLSLAKKEELLYVAGRTAPLRLSRSHLGLRLCQAVRDEAHRFAQHYHHALRAKRLGGR